MLTLRTRQLMRHRLALSFALMSALGAFDSHSATGPNTSKVEEAGTVPMALRVRSPLDYQVYQRGSHDRGAITISTEMDAGIRLGDSIEARLEGGNSVAQWIKLARLQAGQTRFRVDLAALAGGWYRLDLRLKRNETTLAEVSVAHVGIGEVFVIAGQSNSANHGEERQTSATQRVSAFHNGRWQLANDPQPGASGGGGSFIPPFADAMVTRLHVPVGVVALGAGGTSVREWLPVGTPFTNPPTVLQNVRRLPSGEWESKGTLYANLVAQLRPLGLNGFRAILWHQGESDANQTDPSRTLAGESYRGFMELLIRESSRELDWRPPWFVAQVSYHTSIDTGSSEIRNAQAALWKSGVALEGPDSDSLIGAMRENGGKGVHFSGPGLRAHGALWVEKVLPWLETHLAKADPIASPAQTAAKPKTPRLELPGLENLTIEGRPAFLFLPPKPKQSHPQPWIFYAPTLSGTPDEAERWMHEQFVSAGVAVVGVDVGEAYGSPKSHAVFDALHRELTKSRGFAEKPCLFGRSRGGLWVTSWAIAHPERVAGIIGIYPVFDFRTYPGLKNAAPAYGLTPAELEARAGEFNPIERVSILAKARIPVVLVHGDTDTVVPLLENSSRFVQTYEDAGSGSLIRLKVLENQGHNMFDGFFQARELVEFAIDRARSAANP